MTRIGAVPGAVQLDFAPILDLGPLRGAAPGARVGRGHRRGARSGSRAAPATSSGRRPPTSRSSCSRPSRARSSAGASSHGLAFASAYAPEPMALLDLGRGSLSLAGAVVGGALTAGYVCRQLGFRMAAWADAATLPVLLAIGGGKVAMLLGGAGQGLPWDGRGGVSFLGDGPWSGVDPAIPAYPTQLLEGLWALLGHPDPGAAGASSRGPLAGVLALGGAGVVAGGTGRHRRLVA